jgi:hypothetical protein
VALSVVQVAANRSNNGTFTTTTSTFTNTPAVGNVMLALVGKASNSAVTAPSGWTADASSVTASASAYLYHRSVQPGDGKSYSWSWTGSVAAGSTIWEVSGQNAGTPIDVTNALGHTTTSTVSITTTIDGDLIVAGVIGQDNIGGIGTSTFTAGGGYTTDLNSFNASGNSTRAMGNFAEHQTQVTHGAINDGVTVGYFNGEIWEARGIFGVQKPAPPASQPEGYQGAV